ncbi:hypothetical protein [Bosea sp. (in: a-proteobacteria)]|uniref:hypothetical protein n=1 Tax=Bosea sp. (in: a-proteobacteria) TaxID=1871050 RepID=UPI003B3B8252
MPQAIRRALWLSTLALAMPVAALAQQEGWGSSYTMGTLAVGVAVPGKARLTFYCGEKSAARANKLIKSGPYLEVSLPKAVGLDKATSLDLVIDGRQTSIPVTAEAEGESVSLRWEPGARFGAKPMKGVVAGLAKAKTATIKAAGQTAELPLAGAAKALADDPLGC